MHKTIQLKDISLFFPHKVCFENFSTEISYGNRIAIIGNNGSGKSSLLKMLYGILPPTEGEIKILDDARMGYVPQVIENFAALSGGQRLNESLTQALSLDPNVLLLDEPTNHLDLSNRKSLMRMLKSYHGSLIVVTHDLELLRHCIDTLWHIDNGLIHIFSGNYDDYMREICIKRTSIEQELSRLARDKKETHQSLMKEQTRAAKSRSKGEKSIENRKWPTVVSNAKALRAGETTGRKKSEISTKRTELNERLSELRLPEIIKPKFSLTAAEIGSKNIVTINEGGVGYKDNVVLRDINFSVSAKERLAIIGDNGSGKSTFIKAIMHDENVIRSGNWFVPKAQDIGYLDQHYNTLSADDSVIESVHKLVPAWSPVEVRRHLNDFLFRKNEEVNASVSSLSGGEKARLSLAQIAAKTPKLLILDEITNNLDLETRAYVIQVLKEYPGSIIVISHDQDFMKLIDIESFYYCEYGTMLRKDEEYF